MNFSRVASIAALMLLVMGPSNFVAAESDADKAGTVAFKFLNLPYSTRGATLGGLAAQASGAEAMFWNPAGLARAGGLGLTASMTQWLVETSYLSSGAVLPLAGGVVGISFLMVDYGETLRSGWSGETEFVFEAKQDPPSFSASDIAIQLSYGRFLSDKFSLGVTVKAIAEQIDGEAINGFAFDVGTQFNTGYRGIHMGAVISNFGPDISPVSIPEGFSYAEFPGVSLPMTFSFGIDGQVLGDRNAGLVTGLNVVKYADMAQRFAVSFEYALMGMAHLRGSYTLGYDQGPVSVGAGLKLAGITVDLGVTTMTDFDLVTRISVNYQL